jgi:hypothetical protein
VVKRHPKNIPIKCTVKWFRTIKTVFSSG